jgi:hypothetical protein
MAPVRPVLQRLSCCNETVRNAPKHKFWVQWSESHAFVAKKANAASFSELNALMALVRQILHQLSCSNETVRDAPKHEFWVQWSGSGALVVKT